MERVDEDLLVLLVQMGSSMPEAMGAMAAAVVELLITM